MGVYIPSLELPNKDYGKMVVTIYPDGSVVEYLGDIGRDFGTAIPVPPHGRLIDADALRKSMYHEAFETDTPMQKWDSGCWIRYKLFEQQQEASPTIIPASKET